MSERILVIDDDEDSLKLISLMLRRQGYNVLTANAGNPGLSTAFAERPDLILLDVMMPDMDGLEVCRRLRDEPMTAETPIIMFTAKALVEDKIDGFEAGVTDYLTKPTHPAELAARVKSALSIVPRKGEARKVSSTGQLGQSIGFVGAKGGIGTTTIAASVGAILAQSQTTILTDIRPGQGTLGISLGISENAGVGRVLNLPLRQIKHATVAQNLVSHSSKMQLLLSSPNPQEVTFNYSPESVVALRGALATQAYYCLFDLGAGLDRITVPLMRDLDTIIVITESTLMSLTTASAMLIVLETRIPKEKIRLVISNRGQLGKPMTQDEVEEKVGHKVSAVIPADPVVVSQAVEAGMALTQFQPNSAVAREIFNFIEELSR